MPSIVKMVVGKACQEYAIGILSGAAHVIRVEQFEIEVEILRQLDWRSEVERYPKIHGRRLGSI